MSFSNYEELRRKNIEDNKRILAEIGLVNPFKALPKVTLKKSGFKRKAESQHPRQNKRPLLEQNIDVSSHGSLKGIRRRSARLQGSATPTEEELKKQVEQWQEEEEDAPRKVEPNRPNFYGAIEGVDVGTVWLTRMECCRDGIHRPTVAGIHRGAEGAYSIALSGGYDDNIDLGDCFTYTGEGGRDLKGTANNPKNLRTAPQSKDQTLTRGNLALSTNVETGHPVRVIRGYKLTSPFAPEEGYRYDGLYSVQKAWFTTGVSGFKVWKFALKRCENQAPPPWTFAEGCDKDMEKINNNEENKPDLNQMNDNSERTEGKKNTVNKSVAVCPEKPAENESCDLEKGEDDKVLNEERSTTDKVTENGNESNTIEDECETSAGKKNTEGGDGTVNETKTNDDMSGKESTVTNEETNAIDKLPEENNESNTIENDQNNLNTDETIVNGNA